MRRYAAYSIMVLLALVGFVLIGCSKTIVRFIPEGGSYDMRAVERRARDYDLGRLPNVRASEGASLRREALIELRRQGSSGIAVAELLTRRFPSRGAGVPVLVEGADVDGRGVWVIVEASAGSDGRLSRRRLWLLDKDTGEVVSSVTFR